MKNPAILHRHLLGVFLPSFAMATGFFVFILELADLFANLVRYLSLNVPLQEIFRASLLYAPTCLTWALPIAILFAVSFALGSLYASNELIAIFGSGISLLRFTIPLMIVGCLISIASYFFGDQVTLPSYRAKTRLVSTLLGQKPSLSNSNVTVLSRGGTTIYHAGFYDDGAGSIAGLSVIERDSLGQPKARTEAASARWQGGAWLLSKVRRFDRTDDGQWKETDFGSYANPDFSEPIESFRSQNFDIGELTVTELGARATFQKNAGLPFSSTLAERHRRFAFAFVPLVVVLLSASIGGRYRKNVLLMSLLVSLVIATGYYVLQMIGMLLAKTGVLAPVIGAWAPLVVFGLLALALFGRART